MKVFEGFRAVVRAALVTAGILLLTSPGVAGNEEKKSPNPLAGNAKAIEEGQQLFRTNVCGHCHGMNARGGGRGHPLAANLQKYKRGYTAYLKTVREGYKQMPPWGGGPPLDEETLNRIGAWLESIALPEAVWQDPKQGG